jgi:hypothetical protein
MKLKVIAIGVCALVVIGFLLDTPEEFVLASARLGGPGSSGAFDAKVTRRQLCYSMDFVVPGKVTHAHISLGHGEDGGLATLYNDPLPKDRPACVDIVPGRYDAFVANPQHFYVHIHAQGVPGLAAAGPLEIRGGTE